MSTLAEQFGKLVNAELSIFDDAIRQVEGSLLARLAVRELARRRQELRNHAVAAYELLRDVDAQIEATEAMRHKEGK